MKMTLKQNITIIALSLGLGLFTISCSKDSANQESKEKELGVKDGAYQIKTDMEKPTEMNERLTYSMAYALSMDWHRNGINIDMDYLVRGILDAKLNKQPLLDEKERMNAQGEFERFQIKREKERMSQSSDIMIKKGKVNLVEGPKFLKTFSEMSGVKATASGLLYKVIKSGNGEKPNADSDVMVRFTSTFVDGTEVTNTDRENAGDPVKIPLRRMFPGWKEALVMMPVGSTWQVVIPSNLAFGEKGDNRIIPPHAVLIFEIELVSIVNK